MALALSIRCDDEKDGRDVVTSVRFQTNEWSDRSRQGWAPPKIIITFKIYMAIILWHSRAECTLRFHVEYMRIDFAYTFSATNSNSYLLSASKVHFAFRFGPHTRTTIPSAQFVWDRVPSSIAVVVVPQHIEFQSTALNGCRENDAISMLWVQQSNEWRNWSKASNKIKFKRRTIQQVVRNRRVRLALWRSMM